MACLDIICFLCYGFSKVFINVPWWYLAFYMVINPFLTQRTKSKFVFASPAKSPGTLFKLVKILGYLHEKFQLY